MLVVAGSHDAPTPHAVMQTGREQELYASPSQSALLIQESNMLPLRTLGEFNNACIAVTVLSLEC